MSRRVGPLLLGALVLSCAQPTPARVTAERLVLERELDSLSSYLQVDFGRLLVEGDLLLVVRQELVGDLLAGGLPLTGVLPGGHQVRLDAAEVSFRTGLALIELQGRVSAADRAGTFADVTVFAALEVPGISADPPGLRARPRVLAVETRDVGVAGLAPPAERLIDEIARRRLGELESLLGDLELPLSVEGSVTLPAVDAGGVRIPAQALSPAATVEQVLVADRRLWVLVDLDLPEQASNGTATRLPEEGR